MNEKIKSQIIEASQTAFIDKQIQSNLLFKPTFLFNDSEEGCKVLTAIKEDLDSCSEFFISVAFITESGITPLLQVLKDLEESNIPGKILTTDYLAFSEPKALEKLNELKNIEVRMYNVDSNNPGLHTKGYLFKKDEFYKIILGSSNITQNALTVNKEWNIGFSSTEDGEITEEILKEFKNLWKVSTPLDDCIANYKDKYNKQRIILKQRVLPTYEETVFKPNTMQKAFIKNLNKLYKQGENKALLISATGTGKTYAAAFALKDKYPKKALFLVHREQIAKQALGTFKNVFGNTKSMSLLSGNSKDYSGDYLFSTVQMMSKENEFRKFSPDEFDYIIIDEVHRAGAKSYQKIFDYFNPKFLLGMTASPDRTDGFDIYDLFDHNIAYEIRLKQALEEDLLCPFHYFGIKDLLINNEEASFDNLIANDRVDYIIEKCRYFGYCGKRVKGLMFCSDKKEAHELSKKLNEKGLKTLALTGENSQEERLEAIDRLVTDERLDYLDYILTVDIFNEGVDIPEINQVILLRETKSPIVFIQQLGRGLRKADKKDYVVILDFIGIYKNNFMIPIALSGDRTHNKDNLRKYVMEGNNVIPGNSTINFDKISKERIFKSIDDTNMSTASILKEKYRNIKYKLGKIPTLVEFYNLGEIDPILILEDKKLNYYKFLSKYDDDFDLKFDENQEDLLEFISKEIANGKRPHELLIIKNLMEKGYFTREEIANQLEDEYHIIDDLDSIENAISILNLSYYTNKVQKKYKNVKFFNSDFKISDNFKEALENYSYEKFFSDLIDYSFLKYEKEYEDRYRDTNLVLNKEYSKTDALRLLNWQQEIIPLNIGGYRFDKDTCAIFVNYKKNEDEIQYNDKFINQNLLSWMSRKNRTLESKELQPLFDFKNNNLKIHLFVRKNTDLNFYYLGEVNPIEYKAVTMSEDDNEINLVNFQLKLDNIVRYDIYSYLEDSTPL